MKPKPTAESITIVKKELSQLIKKKKTIESDLLKLEKQIYNLEDAYFEETRQFGNIMHNYDGYVLNNSVNSRQHHLKEEDRYFSKSSVNYGRVVDSNFEVFK